MACDVPIISLTMIRCAEKSKGPRAGGPLVPLASQRQSVLLDLLEHLEDALGRTDEHAFEGFGKATPLERVATGTGTFGHACSSTVLCGYQKN
jgi:hypothetical protein